MRTLSSTFSKQDEAEAAARRLEAIGIPSERIVMKEVAAPDGAAGSALFMSVKVPTDQVAAVNQIMKGEWSDEEEDDPVAAAPPPPPIQSPAPARSVDRAPAPPHAQESVRAAPSSAAVHGSATTAPTGDRDRLRRYILLYLVALVAAFLIGAGLGLIG